MGTYFWDKKFPYPCSSQFLLLVISYFMRHYICTGGCGGETSAPGVCETEDCHKEGEALTPCDCEDGSHKNADPEEKDED